MKKVSSTLIWGIILVVVGGLALLGNLNLLGEVADLIWALMFAVAGVAFLYVFLRDRKQWWALIPGLGSLGLGLLIAAGDRLPGDWDAILFLGPLALSFMFIYALRRDFWWALIPGGTLLSVCLVVLASNQNAFDAGSLMLLGLGATFAAVALVPTPHGHMKWAWIPAGVLGAIGLLVLAESVHVAAYVWPLAIIAVGAFFLLRALAGKPKEDKPAEPPMPPTPPTA